MLSDDAPDPRRWKGLVLLCVAFFMVTLDASIVLGVLPSIGAALGFADADLPWVMSAYGLTYGGLLLLGGRCADLLGRRRLFMVGIGVFAVSSLLCGLAWSGDALIAARALQGVSAAIMTPTALAILTTTFAEGSERNKALGAWGSLGGAGGSAGWLAGGPITAGLGWEWIFFINLPVSAVLLALSPRLLNESRAAGRRGFDLAGAATVTGALVLMAYAVIEAPKAGWASAQTLGLLLLAALLAAAFFAIEARSASPLVPLRALRSRTLLGGNLVLVALGMGAFGTPFVLTLYGQEVLGYTPLQVGASFVVTPISVTIGSLLGQRIAGQSGYRSVTCAGLVLMAAGTLLLTRVPVDGSYLTDILPALLLFGPGIGAVFVAASIATLAGVSEEDSGLASGLNNTSFQIGTALGVAVLSTVVVSRTGGGERLVALTDGLQSAFAVAIAFPAAGLPVALLLLGRGVSKSRLGLRRLVEAASPGGDIEKESTMSSPDRNETGTELDPRRWKALGLLVTAFFMVILDSAIVVVALPSIDADLGFSAGDLQWVLSAYLLTFGGLLLLGGRASDLLGRRRMFILGTGLFALASLGAGLAGSAAALLTARALQGVAAAVMTPTAMSIVMTTFPEGPERNKALGIWGSTGAIGGTAAWLVGGPITSGLGWEWIFFINVPVAALVAALSPMLLRESRGQLGQRRFDLAGAATITAALVALVYAVVQAPEAGWTGPQTLGLLALAAILTAAFAAIESRSVAPLAPLRVFRSRALVGGNLVLFLLGTAGFGVPFILTQYAQQVLGWSPIQFGLASLVIPLTAVIGTASAQAIATRGGVRQAALTAMTLTAIGSLLLTQVSVGGSYLTDLALAMPFLGIGVGAAFVAGSIASLTGVPETEAGLASGLNNASFQIGSAVGVAILSSVAVSGAHGPDRLTALTEGYQSAFAAAIIIATLGAIAAALLLGKRRQAPATADTQPATA